MTGFIGAHITSNKNIAVNTGNYMGSIHTEGFQDGGMVQIVPTNLLGTEHVVVEGGGGPVMERPLVVAISDGTEIYLNDEVAPVATIDEGDYYLIAESYYGGTLHKNMVIRTSTPAYVYQPTAANTSSATSEFNFIPPLACYLTDFIDAIPDIDRIGTTVFDGILYVVTTTGSTVTVNGAPLPPTAGPEPATGLPDWETYNLIVDGNVKIESTGAMAAGFVSVNGNAAAGAYYAGFTFDFQVDAGMDTALCIGQEITLTATGAGDGGTYDWADGVTDGEAFTPTETATYYVVGSNIEGCEDEDSIVVTINELSESDAGADQSLCDTTATTLDGNVPGEFGEGMWSMATGPSTPTFENVNDPTTEVGDLTEGTYNFVWTVTNGACPPATDTVQVFVYSAPVSSAGDDQSLCGVYTTALEGNLLLGTSTGSWSFLSGPETPSIDNLNDPTTLVSDFIEGTYSLAWTVSNGTCPPVTDTVFIFVYDEPLSDAGEDQELCDLSTTNLAGNEPLGSSTGTWTIATGPSIPTFADPTNETTAVAGLTEGMYTFVWTVSNGTCEPVTDTVVVTTYDLPLSNAGETIDICDTNATLLNATTPTGTSNGEWFFVTGPSTPTITDATNPSALVEGLILGTYTFVWTVSNGVCELAYDTVEVIVHPAPVVNFLANVNEGCEPLEVAFTNLSTPTGESCLWSFGDGSTEVGCGDVFHTFGAGTFDVTLTVQANGCISATTYPEYITVHPYAIADFSMSPTTLNITNTTVNFTNNSENATQYNWDFGDGTPAVTDFEPVHTYSENIEGDYEVRLIATNDFGCADTAFQRIQYEDLLIYYIPNAFTPNNLGPNDVFYPVFTSRVSPSNLSFKIYDRWGTIIFESNDLTTGWDGTYLGVLVQDGVYVWDLTFKDTLTDLVFKETGHVTLFK